MAALLHQLDYVRPPLEPSPAPPVKLRFGIISLCIGVVCFCAELYVDTVLGLGRHLAVPSMKILSNFLVAGVMLGVIGLYQRQSRWATIAGLVICVVELFLFYPPAFTL